MLVFLACSLEMRNMNNDGVIDVLEEFTASVYDGFVVDSFQLDIDVGEALIVLEVGVLEVYLVASLHQA